MFSFFKKKPSPDNAATETAQPAEPARKTWLVKLKAGLRKTGSSIATVFTGTRIDEALYEDLEAALLMADSGVKATQYLLDDLKKRVRDSRTSEPAAVKELLAESFSNLLQVLEKPLMIGQYTPTVIMVTGVISQQGGDPAAVSFDAVSAGKARGKDVVLVDTAGRLPTQLHLMEELRKIKRVIQKADATAPHEILLVIDGNTGQNALSQVKAFDDALQLSGLIITKLDGTAKGGVLAAIARERPLPVYFIGVGEKLEDLETFTAREFAQALLS